MRTALCVLVAASASACAQYRYVGYAVDEHRSLATPAPIVYNRAMQWHGVPSVGREWHGRAVIGGVRPEMPFPWGAPGPAAYGAHEYDFSVAYARVGTVVVSISPWVEVPGQGVMGLMEEARQLWLREQGYVGGTRTFRNPVHAHAPQVQEGAMLEDRQWNSIQIFVPRRPEFEVRAAPARPDRVVMGIQGDLRVVRGPSLAQHVADAR
ncbi:MAG: hypothetical protein KIT24_02815 [Phycisphaeraceae bacterium]|nr:hypothetical protein [Phycisphaeraceae bacterium]